MINLVSLLAALQDPAKMKEILDPAMKPLHELAAAMVRLGQQQQMIVDRLDEIDRRLTVLAGDGERAADGDRG